MEPRGSLFKLMTDSHHTIYPQCINTYCDTLRRLMREWMEYSFQGFSTSSVWFICMINVFIFSWSCPGRLASSEWSGYSSSLCPPRKSWQHSPASSDEWSQHDGHVWHFVPAAFPAHLASCISSLYSPCPPPSAWPGPSSPASCAPALLQRAFWTRGASVCGDALSVGWKL